MVRFLQHQCERAGQPNTQLTIIKSTINGLEPRTDPEQSI
jgi:hypothetical protein